MVIADLVVGLTFPWALVEYPDAVKTLKTALEQGSNFWNGVSLSFNCFLPTVLEQEIM